MAPNQLALFRILDASANRAMEGLRTVEDYLRFCVNDSSATELAKQLRHRLATTMGHFDRRQLLAARNTPGDVGTSLSTPTERERSSPLAVAIAAMQRVQEALRSLEEYSKVVSSELAGHFESLRYDCYSLAQRFETTAHRASRIVNAQLYVLVDCAAPMPLWQQQIRALVAAGTHIIQIRDKQIDDRQLWERAAWASQTIRADRGPGNCQLIINDRTDIALAVDADGVHVGQEELPVPIVRQMLGPDKLIGLSTHDLAQAQEAESLDVDYIGCGPTFPSNTKSFEDFAGLPFLAEVAAKICLPAFAIGGITLTNLDQVLATGFSRVAVSHAVWGHPEMALQAAAFKERLLSKSSLPTSTPRELQ